MEPTQEQKEIKEAHQLLRDFIEHRFPGQDDPRREEYLRNRLLERVEEAIGK